MPDLTQVLPTFTLVRETTQRELPAIIHALDEARSKGDMTICLPYFWGHNDIEQPIPGAWLTSLADPLKGAKGGRLVEMLFGSPSARFPSWRNTVYWAILIEKSHRLATRDECLAFFKQQDERKAQMAEAELRLRKSKSVVVQPLDKSDFGGGSESLESLRERVKLMREMRQMEAK